MIQSNNLIGKKIISLYNCKAYGVISNLYITNRYKCKFVEINNDELYIIDTKNLLEYNNETVVIKNSSLMQLKSNFDLYLNDCKTLIGAEVYTTAGKYIGKVNLITLTDNYYIESITTDSNIVISKKQIFNISEQICLINDSDKNIKLQYCKPKKIAILKNTLSDISVKILEPKQKKINSLSPTTTKTINSSAIINRTCTKTILTSNGEIVCKIGTKITHDIVKKSQLFGKLFELVKYSK